MERPKTPPRATQPAPVVSPPTPAVTRRIEENRLRAKAIRDQHEQARLASGAPGLDKTPSGFIATDNWGSEEKLDAEFARREDEKRARKEKKFKEKLTDLKRKTRTEAFRRQAAKGAAGGPTKFGDAVSGGKHVHEWGRTVENEEGMTVKTCVGCGMEVEELEF
ncbi:NAD(+) kinase [Verticillium dahliae VDG1]|nr:NAD(+) kinase [Verticillium dahliae VDG1]